VTITPTFTPGVNDTTGLTVIQSFTTAAPNSTPYVAGPNESVTGTVNSYQSDVGGEAVGPVASPGGGSFISIFGNGEYSIDLNAGVTVFSFLLGGLDSYNRLVLSFADASQIILDGKAIIGQPPAAGTNYGDTGRVTYQISGSTLTNAAFSSSQNSMEIDEIAVAVPEPATWAMLLLGFGIAGSALRRSRRRPKSGTLAYA